MDNIYVLDTSIIIDGRIVDLVREKEVEGTLIVPNAAIAELEHQANLNKEIGFTGFSIIKRLREMEKEYNIKIEVNGERPLPHQIKFAKETGEIDALIRKLAKELGAILITGDKVQHLAAEAEGIETLYLRSRERIKELEFEKYFDKDVMSIHLRENSNVVVKKGKPGSWKLVELPTILNSEDMRRIGEEIIEATKRNVNYYVEIDRKGATVIQMGDYRIVIAKQPFSDAFEITVVRPIAKLSLKDYHLDVRLKERIDKEAEGIIIAGPPGSGKTTFASALADYYASKGKIVKTMEDPRDMKVSNEITQYTRLEGSYEYTKEILLLVRPDYVFFDEVRKTEEFSVYADMRMAGIGLVGVVHAQRAIDAVQRFINKVELGVIPQIVDTIILIKGGRVAKVYELEHTIKVPTGMTEKDLARPVIEVRDFFSKELEYEIYKFGEETVVLPVKKVKARTSSKKTNALERVLKRLLSYEFKIAKEGDLWVLYAHPNDIPKLFKKYKKRFERLQKKYGPIEVREI